MGVDGDQAPPATQTPAAGGDRQFGSGYQEIEYPHIQRRQVIKPAVATLKVVDVETVPQRVLQEHLIDAVGHEAKPPGRIVARPLRVGGKKPRDLAVRRAGRLGVAHERRALAAFVAQRMDDNVILLAINFEIIFGPVGGDCPTEEGDPWMRTPGRRSCRPRC